jgi:hypothetical protein
MARLWLKASSARSPKFITTAYSLASEHIALSPSNFTDLVCIMNLAIQKLPSPFLAMLVLPSIGESDLHWTGRQPVSFIQLSLYGWDLQHVGGFACYPFKGR